MPLPGVYNSDVARVGIAYSLMRPPTTSTSPEGSSVAVWAERVTERLPVDDQVSQAGSTVAKNRKDTTSVAAPTDTRKAAWTPEGRQEGAVQVTVLVVAVACATLKPPVLANQENWSGLPRGSTAAAWKTSVPFPPTVDVGLGVSVNRGGMAVSASGV